MGDRISLALVFHNHQPVGNFGWVIEELWERAYGPMIAALERHPSVRVGLHYTGPLLEWLAANQPEAPARIAALVRRGQAELLGGGWYEPILVALPDADRLAQLSRMADEVERLCGVRPRGAWLAERVWEPSLAYDLAAAGYEYTVLDDNHLRGAAVRDEDMWGTYVVDDRGRMLTVFGAEQGLRYLIPWRPVPEVIGHLRSHATPDGRRLGIMGDDGEKFGAWPDTYEYCWGAAGWVERFFSALEAESGWLTTVRPSDWLDEQPPLGRIAVPASSYVEMTEWALPPADALVFHELLADARRRNDPAARFLRGGTWRAFQARYREINELHKQMLRASAAVAALPEGDRRLRAQDHLHRGQSNDVYWHGLFGGIYLADLRVAALAELIAAEDLAAGGQVATARADFDLDGLDEVLLGGPGQTLLIDLAEGGAIGAWDLLAGRLPLASVLRRRPEAIHARLKAAVEAGTAGPASDQPISPHDAVVVKEPGLERYLVYDRHERRSCLVHLLDPAVAAGLGAAELSAEEFDDQADLAEEPYEVEELTEGRLVLRRDGAVHPSGPRRDGSAGGDGGWPVTLIKRFELGGTRLSPELALKAELRNRGDTGLETELDLEWAFQMLGGGGNPAAWYAVPDDAAVTTRTPHDGSGDVAGVDRLAFGNDQLGVRLEALLEPAARVIWHAIETVSNSEGGFERVYQGSALHLRWPLVLAAGATASVGVRFSATQDRDRLEEETRGFADKTPADQRGGASQRLHPKAGRKPSRS